MGRDPYVQGIAAFRGISYKEAEKQLAEAADVEVAESLIVHGKPLVFVATDMSPFAGVGDAPVKKPPCSC